MNQLLLVALMVVALASAQAVYYLVRFLGERHTDTLRRRLRLVGEPEAGVQILRRSLLAESPRLSEILRGFPGAERLGGLIEQTDLELTVAKLFFQSLLLAGVGVLIGIFMHRTGLAALLGVVGLGLPIIRLYSARSRRSVRISEQLPEALGMMVRSLRAGRALASSFQLVARECPPPIAIEFARVYEQQNLGLALHEAILNMTKRVPGNLDLRLFAVSVNIHRETGGNLAEGLENIAQTMRERFTFHSKLRALTAEGRMSAIVMALLPLIVGVMASAMNPEYMAELTKGVGRLILAAGFVLWCLGLLWTRVLLRVDY